jgi:ATP-binding cassette, subfamily B, bacterial
VRSFRAICELLSIAWRIDRRKLISSFLLLGAGFAATPFIALTLSALTNALLAGNPARATRLSVLLAVLVVFELLGMHFAHLSYFELGEMTQTYLQHRLFAAVNRDVPLVRQEQPDYADDMQVAQSQAWNINRSLEAILQFAGLTVQLVISTILLARLNALLSLVPCLAIFLIVAGTLAQRQIDRSHELAAEDTRRARHFLRLATAPESLLELRLLCLEREVADHHTAAWDRATSQLWRGQARAAVAKSAGQLAFAMGYAAALLLVLRQLASGKATPGDLVLVLALAVQTTLQVTSAVTVLSVAQQAGVTIARIGRLAGIPQAGIPQQSGESEHVVAHPPAERGIILRNVSFAYPGSDRLVLDDISLALAPGAIVAVVGENGAGKSTLIKLLCGLYQPTRGQVWLSGCEVTAPGTNGPPVAALFQDFARIELALRDSVGVGACEGPQVAPDDTVLSALANADLVSLPSQMPDGLGSILGSRYAKGAELSGGQWQRVGLARALVRRRPALLTLDEPSATLDALAENALFERFAAAAHNQDSQDTVTVYVSHRFSTVRMADTIIVLENGRIAERGNHDQLIRAGGTYAQLYTLQAGAYASP